MPYIKYSLSTPVYHFTYACKILNLKLNDRRPGGNNYTSADEEQEAGNRLPLGPTGEKPKWWGTAGIPWDDIPDDPPSEAHSPQTGTVSVAYHREKRRSLFACSFIVSKISTSGLGNGFIASAISL